MTDTSCTRATLLNLEHSYHIDCQMDNFSSYFKLYNKTPKFNETLDDEVPDMMQYRQTFILGPYVSYVCLKFSSRSDYNVHQTARDCATSPALK